MEKAYVGDDKLEKSKLQSLRRQYDLLQMDDQETIVEYFDRLVTLTNRMRNCGELVSDLMKIDK